MGGEGAGNWPTVAADGPAGADRHGETPGRENGVQPPKRHLVVVDIETSGLRSEDIPVEVAWRDVDSGEHGCFVPHHEVGWVRCYGHPVALEMNGYRSRLSNAWQDDGREARRLFMALRGNCLAGSNPMFDAGHLEYVFGETPARMLAGLLDVHAARPLAPWHHRLPDIANYAAGVLGIDPRELIGLEKVCQRLGVQPGDHTAEADVAATAECFRVLTDMATYRHPGEVPS